MSKQTFDFSEALKRMKQGKWVRRKSQPFRYALEHYESMKTDTIWYKINDSNVAFGVSAMNTPDILATDWEEMEEEE